MTPNGRILTTHVGSLPRPARRRRHRLRRGQRRGGRSRRSTSASSARAVADRVRHQVDAGIDIVSDGEMSKIGYATYIRHRLSGFELGDVPRATPGRPRRLPVASATASPQAGATAKYQRPICRGPIAYEHREPLERDLAHLRAAVDGRRVAGAFMNAPSPGIIALFQPNEYYGSARRVPRRASPRR